MSSIFTSLLLAGLGAILASLAGVISERLHTGESWLHGRSKCNSCARPLTGFDLVPIFSWVFSGGKCRTCKASVPYVYALTEVTLGILFYVAANSYGLTLALLPLLASLFLLAVVVLYDLRHTIVPMSAALLLILTAFSFALVTSANTHALGMTFLTAGLIGLGFFLMHVLSGGRWMGLGDAPIALALSLLVGTQAFAGLLFSFWIGAVIGIGILVASRPGHRIGIEVPFVPFLAAGYLLAFFTQWNPLPF